MLIGQAPGQAAHESDIPWNDRSGNRLREWLGLSSAVFYNDSAVALMPMGFCFPGKGQAGDLPPRPVCAPLWHDAILKSLMKVELTVIIGQYAFQRYLGDSYDSITDAVRDYDSHLPRRIALPHPSPRNSFWLKRNPWFESELLPTLRVRVADMFAEPVGDTTEAARSGSQ